MSGVVLVLGALLAIAGVYEMVVGSSDILSERGWSGFIAGAVFVAGGVSTLGLGFAVRAVDRLRLALSASPTSSTLDPVALEAVPERLAPGSLASTSFTPSIEPVPAPPASAPSSPASAPMREDAMLVAPAVAASIPAAIPAEAVSRESDVSLSAQEHEPAAENEIPVPGSTTGRDYDWLDQNFADLEREMAVEEAPPPTQPMAADHQVAAHQVAAHQVADHQIAAHSAAHAEPLRAETVHAEPWDAEPLGPELSQPVHADRHGTHEATLLEERPIAEAATDVADAPHEPPTSRPAPDGGAIVAAREVPAPTTSPVIGRYESEGTSYVMYADGSIDAQSEAGVYRFASMAELKAFIEG